MTIVIFFKFSLTSGKLYSLFFNGIYLKVSHETQTFFESTRVSIFQYKNLLGFQLEFHLVKTP